MNADFFQDQPMMSVLLDRLNSLLPKPLVFALYGSLGCLLAALVVGEPLWWCLAPSPPPPPKPLLQIAASPGVIVQQGGQNSFSVTLLREHFGGEVRIECPALPPGVRVDPVTISRETNGAEMVVSVADTAASTKQAISVIGRALGPIEARAETKLRLTVFEPPRPQVDVLFVVDVTGSMQWAINGIRVGIQAFAGELEKQKLDANVGLIAYRDNFGHERAEVVTFSGRPLTNDYTEFSRQVGTLSANGGGDTPESTLDALALAAEQSFRSEATRVLLLVTDALPHVPDTKVPSVDEAIALLRKAGIDQVHIVVRRSDLPTYEPLRRAFEGQYFDLDIAARGGNEFAAVLPRISRAIASIMVASSRPAALQAVSQPAPVLKAMQSRQQFRATPLTRLLLAISAWTAVLAAGLSSALIVGQNLYLRRGCGSRADLAKGLGGGFAAGFLGGAAGQFLFQTFTGPTALDGVFRLVGWVLMGSLIGLGMRFFVPNLKASKGLLGGTIGGAGGALGFLLVGWAAGDLAGRLLGACVLGLCLGLMVAWAERAFRSAWLEIRFGRSERCQVNLGPTPVTLGSDARQCTVYVPGVAPVAARYWIEGGRVLREEAGRGRQQDVPPGEEYAVGPVTAVLRTRQGPAERTPVRPAGPPPPPPPGTKAAAPVTSAASAAPGSPTSRPSAPTHQAGSPRDQSPTPTDLGGGTSSRRPPPPPPRLNRSPESPARCRSALRNPRRSSGPKP